MCKKKSTLKAIFVDAGGVLVKPNHERIIALTDDVKVTEEKIDSALYQHGEVGAGLGPGDDDDEFVYNFSKAAGLDVKTIKENFEELRDIILFSPWVARNINEVHDVLLKLKQKGLKVAIVSNTEWGGMESLLNELGICQVGDGAGVNIDAVFDSAEIKIFKPDPKIYKYAAEQFGFKPSECLHIGDSIRNDVRSSKEAGLIPIHFAPYSSSSSEEYKTVSSFSELVEVVNNELHA